jgi:hypothetical protein
MVLRSEISEVTFQNLKNFGKKSTSKYNFRNDVFLKIIIRIIDDILRFLGSLRATQNQVSNFQIIKLKLKRSSDE